MALPLGGFMSAFTTLRLHSGLLQKAGTLEYPKTLTVACCTISELVLFYAIVCPLNSFAGCQVTIKMECSLGADKENIYYLVTLCPLICPNMNQAQRALILIICENTRLAVSPLHRCLMGFTAIRNQ